MESNAVKNSSTYMIIMLLFAVCGLLFFITMCMFEQKDKNQVDVTTQMGHQTGFTQLDKIFDLIVLDFPDSSKIAKDLQGLQKADLDIVKQIRNIDEGIDSALSYSMCDENVMIRMYALWGLYSRNGQAATYIICMALTDHSATVRINAAMMLSQLYPDSQIKLMYAPISDPSLSPIKRKGLANEMIAWALQYHSTEFGKNGFSIDGEAVQNDELELAITGHYLWEDVLPPKPANSERP